MIRLAGLVTDKRTVVKEQEAGVEGHLLPEDITYFKEQLSEAIEQIENIHQEIGMQLEVAGDETGYDVYKQMEAQLSRYMESSIKSLENCDKFFTRVAPRIKSLTTNPGM